MARPTRNNAAYFTHDANLRNDRRIKAIRTQCGAVGYGLLHMLLEALTDADFTQLSTDEEELELLAGDFGVSVTEIGSLLQIGEKVKFFARNEAGLLICPSLRVDNFKLPADQRPVRLHTMSLTKWRTVRAFIFLRDDYTCCYCGERGGRLELEHVLALSKGGTDDYTNLATACRRCNRRKGAKPAAEFRAILANENI